MTDTSIPVRIEPDEHAEWLALAKAAGLTIEQWLVATVRAARAVSLPTPTGLRSDEI